MQRLRIKIELQIVEAEYVIGRHRHLGFTARCADAQHIRQPTAALRQTQRSGVEIDAVDPEIEPRRRQIDDRARGRAELHVHREALVAIGVEIRGGAERHVQQTGIAKHLQIRRIDQRAELDRMIGVDPIRRIIR